MNRLKLVVVFISLLLSLTIKSQILNGSFEDWSLYPDSTEFPTHWDELVKNSNKSLSKSTNSAEGLYAVQLSSLNFIDGTFGPSYIGSKFKPENNLIKFKFKYLIDSISGPCHAVVDFLQKNSEGDYILISTNSYNEILKYYQEESISLNLISLDTILIILRARNHALFVGFDGFISVLFDNLQVELVSSVDNPLQKDVNVIFPNPFNNFIEVNPPSQEVTDITLNDIDGKIVLHANLSCPCTLMTRKFPPGVYIYRISRNAIIETGKLIKI